MAVTYTPTTNFSAKDSLPSNDPSKVIKGSEFSVEFTAIQTAFSLAAPVASPTFTGTVTIPTADINGGNIDGTVIGAATPAAGSFTTGQFGTSLNVDGTVTADGLTVTGRVTIQDATSPELRIVDGNNINSDFLIYSPDGVNSLNIKAGSLQTDAFSISSTGNISFYEDTGTTPKFFWDASAEALGIGTASPVGRLDVSGGADGTIGSITLAQGNTTSKIAKIYGTSVNTNEKGIRLNTFHYGDVDAVTITSDGNVGIGTTSPDQKLDVTDGAITAGGLGTVLIGRYSSGFPSSGDGYFSLTTNNADGINGGISFNTLSSGTLGERARIDSSGNLLVGKTDTTGNVAGVSLRSTGLIVGTVSGGTVGYFNRTTSDGTILDFRKDNTAVGSIGVTGGDILYLSCESHGIKINSDSSRIDPCDGSGTSTDAVLDLGVNTSRFKDLYLSGGVYLGGTGAANLLDDYEEGTFTLSSPSSGYTISSHDARYTKIGRQVTLHFRVTFSAVPASNSSCTFTGVVPFTPSAFTDLHYPALGRDATTTGAQYCGQVISGNTNLIINSQSGISAGSSRTFTTGENYVFCVTFMV